MSAHVGGKARGLTWLSRLLLAAAVISGAYAGYRAFSLGIYLAVSGDVHGEEWRLVRDDPDERAAYQARREEDREFILSRKLEYTFAGGLAAGLALGGVATAGLAWVSRRRKSGSDAPAQ